MAKRRRKSSKGLKGKGKLKKGYKYLRGGRVVKVKVKRGRRRR